VKRIENGSWRLALLFGMRERRFLFYFFVLIFSGAGGWIPRPEMPFADFKTASELENVGGKNEE
jgi:hypothetical protein